MRIAYIVLTCEKYISSRVPWQLQTMFSSIERNDIYFLGHTVDPSRRLFSWGAEDSYEQLPSKFIDFFKHTDLDYDWFILIDDDTYVFTDRLAAFLSLQSPHDSFAVGQLLDHLRDTYCGVYLSGGAGTVISRMLYHQLRVYVRTAPSSMVSCHWCADICLGMWIKQVCGVLIHHPDFHADVYNPSKDDIKKSITFHHLKEWKDYEDMLCKKWDDVWRLILTFLRTFSLLVFCELFLKKFFFANFFAHFFANFFLKSSFLRTFF